MMQALPFIPLAFYVFGYFKIGFIYAGLAAQAIFMVYRGLQLGRLPIIGPHDTLYFMSLSTVLFAVTITHKQQQRMQLLYPMIGLGVLFAGISFLYPPHNAPLPPVLKTFWFESHVALSFFAYALFGVAAVLGLIFLINSNQPSDDLQYKAIIVGYCFFSAAMVFGGIWAYYAWGTYWLWTPKELWTVMLWLFYSLYLHTRLRAWWTGRPSAYMSIAGFLIVMFTYLGVSLFMKSSHSF